MKICRLYNPGLVLILLGFILIGCQSEKPSSIKSYYWRNFLVETLKESHGLEFSKSETDSLFKFLDQQKSSHKNISKYSEHEQISLFKNILYSKIGLTFEKNPDVLNAILPTKTLILKRSTCIGSGLMGLLVAETYDFPIKTIWFDHHLFWTWKSDSLDVNLEPNRGGWTYTDQEYLDKYPGTTIADFNNNSINHFKTAYYFTLGNVQQKLDMNQNAIYWYQKALKFDPINLGIKLNYAISKFNVGDKKEAILLLEELTKNNKNEILERNLELMKRTEK